jgi:hypothetical protein
MVAFSRYVPQIRVRSSIYFMAQDLVARDYHIHLQLKEEAVGLPDIVLTEVGAVSTGHSSRLTCFGSVNCVTSS